MRRDDVTPELTIEMGLVPTPSPVAGDDSADALELGRGPGLRLNQVQRLKLLLAAACAVIAVLGTLVYIDRHESPNQRAVTEAIEAYTSAWNTHDHDALVESMWGSGAFLAGDQLEHPILSATVGPELDRLSTALFRASFGLETTGRIVIAGDNPSHATVAQRCRYVVFGMTVVEDGLSQYTLVRVDGVLKVGQHIWWRPRQTSAPSMLWAV